MITTIYNDQANNFSLILLWQTDISDSENIRKYFTQIWEKSIKLVGQFTIY